MFKFKFSWGTRFPESWGFINADASIASGSFCLSLLSPLPVGHVLSLRQQVLKQNSESICILHTSIQTNIAISGYLCRGCAQCKFDRVRFDFHRITSRISPLLSGSKSEGPVNSVDLLVVEVAVTLLYSNCGLFLGDLVLECSKGVRKRVGNGLPLVGFPS